MGQRTIQIDGAKLEQVIKSMGLHAASISMELGYTDNYICNAYKHSRVSTQTIAWLENKYGIERDSLMPTPEKKEEPKQEKQETGLNFTDICSALAQLSITLSKIEKRLETIEGYSKGIAHSNHDIYDNTVGVADDLHKQVETAEKQYLISKKHYDNWTNFRKYGRIS